MVREQATDQRPEHGRNAEDRTHKSLVLAALCRREQVRDHDERHREEAATAGPLDPPEDDELAHPVAEQR